MIVDTDKWVTIDTYAFLKGIKRRWVYDLIKKGEVQTIKLWGKQLIYIENRNEEDTNNLRTYRLDGGMRIIEKVD